MPTKPGYPDLIGVGAQRAGTTWLHRNLSRHTDVWLVPAPLKEVHYFDELHVPGQENRHKPRRRRINKLSARWEEAERPRHKELETLQWLASNERDDDWYRRVFSMAPKRKLRGEITPAYSLLPPEGVAHIRRLCPDVRLILMLRYPVDRAWSQVRYRLDKRSSPKVVAELSEAKTRELALRADNTARTSYRSIIERYRSVFHEDQLLIAFFDEIRADPEALLARVARHIGVDPRGYKRSEEVSETRHNRSPAAQISPALAAELAAYYRSDVEWLADNVAGTPNSWLERTDAHVAGA